MTTNVLLAWWPRSKANYQINLHAATSNYFNNTHLITFMATSRNEQRKMHSTMRLLFIFRDINQNKCCNLLNCNGVPRIKNSFVWDSCTCLICLGLLFQFQGSFHSKRTWDHLEKNLVQFIHWWEWWDLEKKIAVSSFLFLAFFFWIIMAYIHW